MEGKKHSKFYFKAEDLMALINAGATHIMVTATHENTGVTGSASVEAFDGSGMSKGSKVGCPWPCKGVATDVTQHTLTMANKSLNSTIV